MKSQSDSEFDQINFQNIYYLISNLLVVPRIFISCKFSIWISFDCSLF